MPLAAPDQVPAFPAIHESRNISPLIALKYFSDPRLARNEKHVTHFDLQRHHGTAFPASDELLPIPLDQVNKVRCGQVAASILLQGFRSEWR